MKRYFLHFLTSSIVILLGLPFFAHAEAPMVKTQVPGYYRMLLGDFEITALYDGTIELETKLLKNATPENLQKLLARMFVGNPKMQTAVNAYLINTGKNLVLVDTGAAKLFGPSLGYVVENMKSAGYTPDQVDTVIITHLHPDHVGGLANGNGQAIFSKAKVWVAKEDYDFWLPADQLAKAPEPMKPFFKMAQDIAAPYQKTGNLLTFAEYSDIVPGIQAIKANGHTPGHTAFSVTSNGSRLLIWGDLVHAHAVQFAQPGVSIEFDVDQKKAIATRLGIMKMVAADKSLVAGMHLPFPGIGHVRAEGKGHFAWVPIEFAPMPAANK